MPTERSPIPTPNSTVKGILRLEAAIAYTTEPEKLTCTHCDKELPKITGIWPRWNQVKKVTEWVTVWPQYTCDECLA